MEFNEEIEFTNLGALTTLLEYILFQSKAVPCVYAVMCFPPRLFVWTRHLPKRSSASQSRGQIVQDEFMLQDRLAHWW